MASSARSRTSALVVLGVYAGVIAGLAIVPVTIPLLYRLVLAEGRASQAELYTQTARLGLALDRGESPDLEGPLVVRALENSGQMLLDEGDLDLPPELEDRVCGEASAVLPVSHNGQRLLATCFENHRVRAFAVYPAPDHSYVSIGLFAVALAVIAGLTTALGVLRILRPLSRIESVLDQVRAGDRRVRMKTTRIREIDRLIDRVNSAANAIEEREQGILARVQVAQEIARLVAHEVRNPLQSMELLTSLLKDEDDPAERIALTESIHAEIRTLDDVVTRLLREGATRGSLRLNLQDQDVDELIHHVARMKGNEAANAGVHLSVEPGQVGSLAIDRPLLSRSIENLVSNALRAISDDGRIRLATEADDRGVRIIVEDDGPGIDPELGDSIFDVSVSGAGSTGLGLSLTRGVVEGHGGTVCFEPSPMGGARFVLQLPRSPMSG